MKFSITIPTFKTEYLWLAIKSCLEQTYSDFELIVVDDASPEDIKSIVDQFDDPRLRYYRNDRNCGAIDVVDNWNICLGYCTGDYVICMGDDDMLANNCLEEYVKLIKQFPDLHVYHAQTDVIDKEGNVVDHQQKRPLFQTCIELILNRWNGDIQFIGDFCFEIAALRSQGGFYKLPLAWGSDDISAVRAAEGKGIANTQVSTFLYRSNSQSITQCKLNGIKLHAKLQEREWYRSYFERNRKKILEKGSVAEKAALAQIDKGVFFDYFYGQIAIHLDLLFDESLSNLFFVLKMRKQLNRSVSNLIYIWHKKAKKRLGIKL